MALLRPLLVLAVLALMALVGGFLHFVDRVATMPVRVAEPADAIIVLTGGAARIEEALDLLETGDGQRLLISGVNRQTTGAALQRSLAQSDRLFECCIDLGYAAQNTRGNAEEAAAWISKNSFETVIVVTSSYHMPRSMMELASVIDEAKLIPYAVPARSFRADRWWENPEAGRLLVSEYGKYVVALVRHRFDEADPDAHLARLGAAAN